MSEDAEEWLQTHKPLLDGFLQDLKDVQGAESLISARGAPICSLREVHDDGIDTFIGTLSIMRCFHGELMNTATVDFERAEQNISENDSLEVGDPNIVWSIGGLFFNPHAWSDYGYELWLLTDYLAPSHHRRGIMTDALDTLLHEWAIPRMGVRRILAAAFTGNDGSVKVFERNGFKLVRTIEEHAIVKGRMRGVHVLEWNLDNSL